MEKYCKICGKKYFTKTHNQKWCENCKSVKLVCKLCGTKFNVLRAKYDYYCKKGQKYWFCSTKCNSNFPEYKTISIQKAKQNLLPLLKGNKYREGKTPWNKGNRKKRDNLICEFCGKNFSRLKSAIRGKRIFCSDICKDKSEIGRRKNKEFKEKCKCATLKQFENGMPEETKEKLRIAQIKNIEKQRCNGLPLMPCIGKYETPMLDNLEKCFGYTILRQHRMAGYFLDGYCPALNLAIEIDEPFHKKLEQLNKDKIRQSNIENGLGCQFLRLEVK